jgi:DNA-binding transcriptional MerR regulator
MASPRIGAVTDTQLTGELTIDQLAQRTGMTARNIRAHQSRGLLPPPEVRGRTGYYGTEHIARIELIQELQGEGFNLELIGRLLANAAGSTGEVLGFTRALRVPFADEQPEVVDAAELARQWQSTDVSLLVKAEELGLLRSLGDGQYEVPSPRLARAGAELIALGVPLHKVLDLAVRLRRRADEVADMYVKVFLDIVWRPFEEAGHPEERWPEVRTALERLRPLAADSLLASFQLAMDDAAERAFGRAVSRIDRANRKRR